MADTDHAIGSAYLGAKYAKVIGFQARNYASSAKAGAGTDVLQKVKLTDADGIIFYLDAAARDYATALKNYYIEQDDTITGLGIVVVDATGAAVAAGQQVENVVVASPVTVTILDGATATDYFEITLMVDDSSDGRSTRK